MTVRVWVLILTVMAASGARGVFAQTPPDQEPQGKAFIGGRVTSSTGQPVAGALLRTWSYEAMPSPKMARTNADGRFEFSGLPAGRYVLVLSVNPTLSVNYGAKETGGDGTPIDLGAGQRFDRADFTTPRPSVVEGAIADEFGDPAPNVSVSLLRVEFIADQHRLVPLQMGPVRVTDDKGRYRIPNVPPGTYYVGATTGVYIDQSATGGFAQTFFPGTTDTAAATPVRVAVGQELANVSFALVPATMGTVSGIIVDSSGAGTRGGIFLMPRDLGTITPMSMARGSTAADGTFTLRNVPPGSYALQAFGAGPAGGGSLSAAAFGTSAVTVNSDDQQNVRIAVSPGSAVRGRLIFEGGPPPTPAEVRIGTQPVEFDTNPIVGGGPAPSVINPDWTFSITSNYGRRAVRVDVRQPGWTIKRIAISDRDVTHEALDFRKGDIDAVEITMTTTAPTLAGTVVDPKGAPVYDYTVVLFAADRSRWTFLSRFVQQARANQDGRFKTPGMPPGDYLAIALPAVQGRDWQDPVVLQELERQAQRVTLGDGEARTIQLPLVRRAP